MSRVGRYLAIYLSIGLSVCLSGCLDLQVLLNPAKTKVFTSPDAKPCSRRAIAVPSLMRSGLPNGKRLQTACCQIFLGLIWKRPSATIQHACMHACMHIYIYASPKKIEKLETSKLKWLKRENIAAICNILYFFYPFRCPIKIYEHQSINICVYI